MLRMWLIERVSGAPPRRWTRRGYCNSQRLPGLKRQPSAASVGRDAPNGDLTWRAGQRISRVVLDAPGLPWAQGETSVSALWPKPKPIHVKVVESQPRSDPGQWRAGIWRARSRWGVSPEDNFHVEETIPGL